ncbi:MAG: hypothetical protein O2888_03250 [Chloroflexi bacterium]|nr:hypothetical protein [Chloroflexota bacterium]
MPLITGLAAVLLVLAALAIRDARAGDRFDLVRWQVDTFPNRWVTLAGQLLRGADDEDEVITSYFAHPRGAPERRVLQPELQLLVERRVDLVVRDAGLDSRVPLPRSVFPPVNIQIAAAPYVLVTSPRAVIERRSVDLLRPDLPAERALEIERDAEGPDRSAIVLPTGGVATYPAIVAEPANYRGLLQVAAHEWVHHYLAFYPLGFRYFESPDLRAINETVADIIGDEVAAMVLERWGDPTHRVSAEPSRGVTGPAVDVASCSVICGSRPTLCSPRDASTRLSGGWARSGTILRMLA